MSAELPRAAGVGLAGLVVALAAGGLYLARNSEVRAAGLEPEGLAREAVASSADSALRAPADGPRSASLEPTGESPAAAFLTAYFGPDAPLVRAKLLEGGADLDSMPPPVAPEEFAAMLPSWLIFKDSERDSWRKELETWPTELTTAWLQKRTGLLVELSPEDLEAIDALAGLYTSDINAATDRYLDSLETAMSDELMWGGIKTSPFLAWPPEAPGEKPAFFSMVRAGQGWVARIKIGQEDHPDAYAARAAIAAEIEKRDTDIVQTLLALQ